MHRPMRPRAFVRLLPLLLAVAHSVTAAHSAAPPFESAAFEKLPDEGRAAQVLSALKWRDQQLENFSYRLTFTVQNSPIRPGEPFGAKYQQPSEPRPYALHRLGNQYLFEAEEYGRRGRSRWDGFVYRSLVTEIASGSMTGSLAAPERPYLQQVEFNHLFGLRSFGIERFVDGDIRTVPSTLPQVLDYYLQKKCPLRTQAVKLDGRTLVRLHVLPDERNHVLFWFDPGRDWLPVRYHHRHVPKTHHGDFDDYEASDAVNINTHAVVDAQQAGDLWVPKKLLTWYRLRTNPAQDQNVETTRTYEVTAFTRGGVTEKDLRVPFPPNIDVIDSVAEVSYRTLENGKVEPRPLFVPSLGDARTATDADLAAALEADPLDDAADPALPARTKALRVLDEAREQRLRTADPLRGKPAPALSAEAAWINSPALTLDDLKGKVVILDFFAEWCAPCRNELPLAVRMHEAAGEGKIIIIGVHTAGSDRAAVDRFVAQFKLLYPILIDRPSTDPVFTFGSTCAAYRVRGLPHAIVIDPDGNVVSRGTLNDAWRRAIEISQQ